MRRPNRRPRAFAAAGLAVAALGTAALAPAHAGAESPATDAVVVRAVAGHVDAVEALVRAHGDEVTRELRIIDGFAALVSPSTRADLESSPDVLSVSDDASMHPLATRYSSPLGTSTTSALGYDPVNDTGSLYAIDRIIGADKMWRKGYTGAGVGVAVIDTGITRVPGLHGARHVVNGPDLSFDSGSERMRHLDAFGHGTLMASIIGGNDAWGCGDTAAGCDKEYTDPNNFIGVAPDARLVDVKVGAADGAADVSQVIAAIDWVVQHRNDSGLNIRVINLSYGTASLQSYDIDPLAYAAEQAWKQGIVVVAAAGNDGNDGVASLSDPAYDPHIVAVGADDPMGTYSTDDDVVPDFASHGTHGRPVDLIAPGVHVVGLRVPGSYVDTVLSPGPTGTRFQRGSGTSESTAVVSGLVALMLQQTPNLTPDYIRMRLWANASHLDTTDGNGNWHTTHYARQQAIYYSGAGVARARPGEPTPSVPQWIVQSLWGRPWSTGAGSLEASRGGVHVIDDNGVAVSGETDIFGTQFDSSAMALLEAAGTSWSGGTWNGSRWTGSSWSGSSWSGSRWDSSRWSTSRWSGHSWTGSTWSGSTWSGSTWSGSTWSGSTWHGSSWTGSVWR